MPTPTPDGVKVSALPQRAATQANDRVVVYNPNAPTLKDRVATVPLTALAGPGGAGGNLAATLPVSLAAGALGGVKNGDVFAANSPIEALLRKLLIQAIYPTYAPAALAFTQSAPADGEVGESVANTLTLAFAQGDAGPLAALRILRNGTQVPNGSGATSPLSVTLQLVRALSPSGFQGVADYAAGGKKNVAPAGTPDDRSPAVRSPSAPQAAEVGFGSGALYFTGYYRLFFGPADAAPTNRAGGLALGGTALTNQGNQFILNTGTSQLKQVILLPPGRTLQSVTDLDNQGLNLTAKYVAQPTISVADAGGNAVPGYTPYVLSVATPYTSSARHQFVYA